MDYREQARSDLNNAVKTGKIQKPSRCSVCGTVGSIVEEFRLEGHHNDYRRPLSVVWVCTRCHAELDVQMREETRQSIGLCLEHAEPFRWE